MRADPLKWFQGFGFWRNEQTRQAQLGPANVLQRRVFEWYRICQARGRPCRMVVLKYRRAGSSTAGSALVYTHAQNHDARLGVIGTDYKASSNMLDMVKFFGEHDDFPGWAAPKVGASRKVPADEWEGQSQPLEERVDRVIATRIDFSHGSRIELYTAKNPESARSAGLNGYHSTEPGRWATGGEQDAGETLSAMRNALPKSGFHLALEESTADGAQGAFYETCRTARWPDAQVDAAGEIVDGEPAWVPEFQRGWSLEPAEFGKELQFVFIFAAWFEDARHVPSARLTPGQEQRIRETLDGDEQALIERFGQPGPRGKRLGREVNATVWEQLAWRRGIIKTVCTKGGKEEFAQEYPSSPREAFRASGSPALDPEGVMALEEMIYEDPQWGVMMTQGLTGSVSFERCQKEQAKVAMWEDRIVGCRYLVVVDCMSGAEQVTGTGIKDRHAPLVFRDAYRDTRGTFQRVRLVARIKHPCEWDEKLLFREVALLARYYGTPNDAGAMIVVEVEGGCGTSLALDLLDAGCLVFQRPEFDNVTQRTTKKLGWMTTAPTRRIAIDTLKHYVHEQMLVVHCPAVVSELQTLIINREGKAEASSGAHDDNAMSLAIGLACIEHATEIMPRRLVRRVAEDEQRWQMLGA